MEFKDFYAMLATPLRLGKNRYDGMRNLLDMVTDIQLVYAEKKTDQDCDFTKSKLQAIASGTRSFEPDEVTRILDAGFDSWRLVEAVDRLSEKIKRTLLAKIEPYEPGITVDLVAQWCGDYFGDLLQSVSDDPAQIAQIQASTEQARIKGTWQRLAESLFAEAGAMCPNLNCMTPLTTVDDAGQSKRIGQIVAIDADEDLAGAQNLIVLCPQCASSYTGTNPERIVTLKQIKQQLSKKYAQSITLDPRGIEDEIRRVLESMTRADRVVLQTKIKEPLTISQKITDDPDLQDEVTSRVTRWFNFIDKKLTDMDYAENWTFEKIRHEVKGQYLRLTDRGWTKEEVFDCLTRWLVETTGEKPRPCAVVISYFVQKCEVF
ncbi:hypothetical protein BSR28_08640 [Boudabousia liubingyangii]|nr:hypothetical protein BSR28_08640 [Boudabousia liubingyangii]